MVQRTGSYLRSKHSMKEMENCGSSSLNSSCSRSRHSATLWRKRKVVAQVCTLVAQVVCTLGRKRKVFAQVVCTLVEDMENCCSSSLHSREENESCCPSSPLRFCSSSLHCSCSSSLHSRKERTGSVEGKDEHSEFSGNTRR